VAVVDGQIYIMGGLGKTKKMEAYDPSTDTWSAKASTLRPRARSSASSVNGKIYAMGGNISSGTDSYAFVDEYDPETDTWTEKASMLTPRDSLFSAVVGGKIYAMGGLQWDGDTRSGVTVNNVEAYDPATDTWLPRAPMPTSKSLAVAAVVNDKIYVIGGMSKALSAVTTSVHEYDPSTDTWTAKASLPAKRTWAAAVMRDGLIYVFGGADNYDEPASSSVFVYDPAADSWTEREEMPFERWAMSAGLVDGKVYLIGGSEKPYPYQPYSAEVWEYDLTAVEPATGESGSSAQPAQEPKTPATSAEEIVGEYSQPA
jgi:N-acetylneuraminic acid mutarotase